MSPQASMAPVPRCACLGHRWPGVKHAVACCSEPHIEDEAVRQALAGPRQESEDWRHRAEAMERDRDKALQEAERWKAAADCFRAVVTASPDPDPVETRLQHHILAAVYPHVRSYREQARQDTEAITAAVMAVVQPALDAKDAAQRELLELCGQYAEEANAADRACEREAARAREALAAVAAVRELHRPFPIYDECDHEHPDDVETFEVDDVGYVCADALAFVVCTECCAPDDYQHERCADVHEHTKDGPICRTIAALDAEGQE